MGSKIEVVDGIKGEWRSVTKAEDVKVGQRVRYYGDEIGFEGKKRFVMKIDANKMVDVWDGDVIQAEDIFDFLLWKGTIQAFFPVAEKNPRKEAKVDVGYYRNGWRWAFVSFELVEIHTTCNYSTRAHAIRGARRLCKSIVYECEIVK